jgi:CheY-like chemotaxis protein
MRESVENNQEPTQDRRILLAEDDLDLRLLIAQALHEEGWRVTECPNGLALAETLVSSLESTRPRFDLVVSDVRMPGVTGSSVLEELAEWERLRDLPMILITAFGSPHLHEIARKFGAVSLLEKPFEMAVLTRLIRRTFAGAPPGTRSGAGRRS